MRKLNDLVKQAIDSLMEERVDLGVLENGELGFVTHRL